MYLAHTKEVSIDPNDQAGKESLLRICYIKWLPCSSSLVNISAPSSDVNDNDPYEYHPPLSLASTGSSIGILFFLQESSTTIIKQMSHPCTLPLAQDFGSAAVANQISKWFKVFDDARFWPANWDLVLKAFK